MSYEIDKTCQVNHQALIAIYNKYFSSTGTVKANGVYVEVGAFDGRSFGITWPLARLGWRGLCIEAHPIFAEQCRQNHAKHSVTIENCAVGAVEGETTLYVAFADGGAWSTTVWTEASRMGSLDANRTIAIPMYQLDTLLSRNFIPHGFDLLSVDVEDAELEVLAGFDVRRWMPRVVCIETHEKEPSFVRNWKAAPISAYFRAVGYEKVYADNVNTIFALPLSKVTCQCPHGPDCEQCMIDRIILEPSED